MCPRSRPLPGAIRGDVIRPWDTDAEWDPANVFRSNHNVLPLGSQ
jgi:hypothetical protein